MPDSPPPETLAWLRQCAAAPGARWHRALLAEVEGQAPPEIEPIPPEGLAWLHQSARVHGATYSQVLLHVLERIELLDQDAIEQSRINRFSFEAVIKRLQPLEAAENLRQQDEDAEHAAPDPEESSVDDDDKPQTLHTIALKMVDTLKQLGVLPEILDTLRRAIREPMEQPTVKSLTVGPTPEAAPVATDEELCRAYDDGPTSFAPALRAVYNLGRQHGAAQSPVAQPAPPAAPAGGLVDRVGSLLAQVEPEQNGFTSEDKAARAAIREVAAWMDECGQHGCSLWLRDEADA